MILRQLIATCPLLDYGKIDELIIRFLENRNKEIEYLLTPQLFIYVCHKAYLELRECGSLVHVHCPNGIYVIGNLNASFWDLIMMLATTGLPVTRTIVFLGNYIDDAPQALHTIMFLLLLKIRFPRRIILLRGKHEIWEINKNFGLQKELCEKYHGQGRIMYYNLNEIFDCMPLAAIISDQIYCCHGGISQFVRYRSDIANVPRKSIWSNDIDACMMRSIFTDTIWAEPHFRQTLSYTPSERYCSYYYNKTALMRKLRQLKCRTLICGLPSNSNNLSSHINEDEADGCEELFEGLCYALYSSHMDRKRNFKAAVLLFRFNPAISQVNAEVQYHIFEEKKIAETFESVKNEFVNIRENSHPFVSHLKQTSCQNCVSWRQGIDTTRFQNNRCLSHLEMLHIMMKFGDPLMIKKYVRKITNMQIQELIGFASAYAFPFFLRDRLKNSVASKRQAMLYLEVERPPYPFEWTSPSSFSIWPTLAVTGKQKRHSKSLPEMIHE